MLICGVARSRWVNAVPPRVAGDEARGGRRDLHQAARARVRGLVAEARLLVDDRRDQRRVQVLVRGLLADDVLVAQGQRDLPHRVVERPGAGAPAAAPPDAQHARPTRAARRGRRRSRAGASAPARAGAAAVLIVRDLRSSRTRDNSCLQLLTACRRCGPRSPHVAPSRPATAGARCARSTPRGRARAGALARAALVGHDRDRVVEGRSMPGLEQQRDLHDGGARAARPGALRAPVGHALADPRPQQLLEPLALASGSAKTRARHRRAVHHAVRRDVGAEALDQRRRAPRRCRSSSCTTASVDSVAAPSRRGRASASDLPAPMPPVRPMKGDPRARARDRLGSSAALGLAAASAAARRLGLLGGGLLGGAAGSSGGAGSSGRGASSALLGRRRSPRRRLPRR